MYVNLGDLVLDVINSVIIFQSSLLVLIELTAMGTFVNTRSGKFVITIREESFSCLL